MTVLQAAASCYIELIVKESDNNVKLIVLDRLIALREVPAHEKVLQVIHALINSCSNFIMAVMCIMNYASLPTICCKVFEIVLLTEKILG